MSDTTAPAPNRADLLREAQRRGLLSPEQSAMYAEAERRGLLGGQAAPEREAVPFSKPAKAEALPGGMLFRPEEREMAAFGTAGASSATAPPPQAPFVPKRPEDMTVPDQIAETAMTGLSETGSAIADYTKRAFGDVKEGGTHFKNALRRFALEYVPGVEGWWESKHGRNYLNDEEYEALVDAWKTDQRKKYGADAPGMMVPSRDDIVKLLGKSFGSTAEGATAALDIEDMTEHAAGIVERTNQQMQGRLPEGALRDKVLPYAQEFTKTGQDIIEAPFAAMGDLTAGVGRVAGEGAGMVGLEGAKEFLQGPDVQRGLRAIGQIGPVVAGGAAIHNADVTRQKQRVRQAVDDAARFAMERQRQRRMVRPLDEIFEDMEREQDAGFGEGLQTKGNPAPQDLDRRAPAKAPFERAAQRQVDAGPPPAEFGAGIMDEGAPPFGRRPQAPEPSRGAEPSAPGEPQMLANGKDANGQLVRVMADPDGTLDVVVGGATVSGKDGGFRYSTRPDGQVDIITNDGRTYGTYRNLADATASILTDPAMGIDKPTVERVLKRAAEDPTPRVPDTLPPEAGGPTGLETPGETKPLHRTLQGEDLTDEQRVAGLVDRLAAEDPAAKPEILRVRARDALRAANEPLLIDEVLDREIEKRQFEQSVEPPAPGKTGAEIAAEPPPGTAPADIPQSVRRAIIDARGAEVRRLEDAIARARGRESHEMDVNPDLQAARKRMAEAQETVEQAKALATERGWDWDQIVERTRSEAGLDENFADKTQAAAARSLAEEQARASADDAVRAERVEEQAGRGTPEPTPAREPVLSIEGMTGDDLRAAAERERAWDRDAPIAIFGEEGAKRYERAQRLSNSTATSPEARAAQKAADKLLDEMHRSLTPEQEKRLFGIGEEGLNYEDLRYAADEIQAVETAGTISPADLARSIRADITKLPKEGADPTFDQQVSLAKIRRAMEIAEENGWDLNELSDATLRDAFSRFSDPADAVDMLERFKPQGPKQAPFGREVPSSDRVKDRMRERLEYDERALIEGMDRAREIAPEDVAPSEPAGATREAPPTTDKPQAPFGQRAPATDAQPTESRLASVNPRTVEIDAQRFQFKQSDKQGVTGALHGKKWRQDLADPITVWRDPENGKVYVTDGHQRLNLALKDGADTIDVRFDTTSKTAAEAMRAAAEKNIAAGTASNADVARYFRSQGLKGDALDAFLAEKEIPTTKRVTEQGVHLANLSDDAWNAYLRRDISEAVALKMGELRLPPEIQLELMKRGIASSKVESAAQRLMESAESGGPMEGALPGFEQAQGSRNLFDIEIDIESKLKSRLGEMARQMRGLLRGADTALEKGVAKEIDVSEATRLAEESKRTQGAIAQLLESSSSEVRSRIRDAALEIDEMPKEKQRAAKSAAVERLADEAMEILQRDPATAKMFQEKAAEGPSLFGEPPAETPKAPPFRSGRGIGRNPSEAGAAGTGGPGRGPGDLPTFREVLSGTAKTAGRVGKTVFDVYDRISGLVGDVVHYKDLQRLYDVTQRGLAKPIDAAARAATPLTQKRVPGVVPFFGGKTLQEQFQPIEKRIAGEFLDLHRRLQEGEKDLVAFHGQQALQKARKALRDVSPEDQEILRDYYSSRRPDLPAHLADAKPLLDSVSDFVNKLRDESVDLDMLHPSSRSEYDRYLPRIFEEYEEQAASSVGRPGGPRVEKNKPRRDGDGVILRLDQLREIDAEGMAESVSPHAVITPVGSTVLIKFPQFLPDGTPNPGYKADYKTFMSRIKKALGADRRAADSSLKQAVKDGSVRDAKKAATQRGKARTLGDVVVESFEAITPEEIANLKQMPLPELLAYTIVREGNNVADGLMLQEISRGSDERGPWAVEEERDGYVKLTGPRLGKLRRMWVREDVAEYVVGDRSPVQHSEFTNVLIRRLKWNLTVGSIAGIFRQYMAMPQFVSLFGVVNPFRPDVLRAFGKALDATYFPGRGSENFLEATREMGQRVTFVDVETEGTKSPFGRKPMGSGGKAATTLLAPWMHSEKGRAVSRWLSERYAEPDRLVRNFGYFLARDVYGMSKREAREFVNKASQNYSEVGPIVDRLRRSPMGSLFAAFQSENKRNLFNVARERPIDALIAFTWRHKLKLALAALVAMGMMEDPATDDEEKAIEINLGSQKIPLYHDDEGRVVTLDTRYADLWGDFVPRVAAIGKEDQEWLDTVAENLGFDVNPIYNLAATLMRGEDLYGRKIYDDMDSVVAKVGKSVVHVVESSYPTLNPFPVPDAETGELRPSGWQARQLYAAATGEQHNERIPVLTPGQALLGAFIGVKLTPVEMAQELDRLDRQKQRVERRRDDERDAAAAERAKAYREQTLATEGAVSRGEISEEEGERRRQKSYEQMLEEGEITNRELMLKFADAVGMWIQNNRGEWEQVKGEYQRRSEPVRRALQAQRARLARQMLGEEESSIIGQPIQAPFGR